MPSEAPPYWESDKNGEVTPPENDTLATEIPTGSSRPQPRFLLSLAMIEPAELLGLAQLAEACGYTGITMPDSVFFPKQTSADYPYTSDGKRFWSPETPFIDPVVALSAIGAATAQIELMTNVFKLPLRHPLLVAKEVSSLASLFEGRVSFGVGLSWIPEEFQWLGLNMAKRARRLEESITIIRNCSEQDWSSYAGSEFAYGELTMSPRPKNAPQLLVGGHSEPALERAARMGDGWVSAMVTETQSAEFVSRLHGELDRLGRSTADFRVVVTPVMGPDPDRFSQIFLDGATDAIVAPWFYYGASSPEARLQAVQRFASEVISAL